MRRCLLGDLVEAAAAVAAHSEPQQSVIARRLLAEADAAHRYHKRFGKPHPVWGNGSLMARALAEPRTSQPPPVGSKRFLAALCLVAQLLAAGK